MKPTNCAMFSILTLGCTPSLHLPWPRLLIILTFLLTTMGARRIFFPGVGKLGVGDKSFPAESPAGREAGDGLVVKPPEADDGL